MGEQVLDSQQSDGELPLCGDRMRARQWERCGRRWHVDIWPTMGWTKGARWLTLAMPCSF